MGKFPVVIAVAVFQQQNVTALGRQTGEALGDTLTFGGIDDKPDDFLTQAEMGVAAFFAVNIDCLALNYCNDIALRFWTHRHINFLHILCDGYKSVMHSVFSVSIIIQYVTGNAEH